MVWRYGGEGATHKIWWTSLRTPGGRTPDACAMTVALLTKSSRAKNGDLALWLVGKCKLWLMEKLKISWKVIERTGAKFGSPGISRKYIWRTFHLVVFECI